MDELLSQGKISAEDYKNLKKYGISGLLGTAGGLGLLGSLSGLLVYQIANSVFWAIAGSLGITGSMIGGVVVVAPWIAYITGIFVNPLMWGPAIVLGAFSLGDTNWEKTIASVFFVAMKRQQIIAEQVK